MQIDRLNFFQPFENLPPGHENQLTRALLTLLRFSPLAHECWLRHLALGEHLYQLPEATFYTQRRAIPYVPEEGADPIPLISVFLAPGPSLVSGTVVKASDRSQVLDAIVLYEGHTVVVVENKIADASDQQAGDLNIEGVAVKLAEGLVPVLVMWPDLLADLNRILERDLVGGAEAKLMSDFLLYVEDHFSGLGPYQNLRLCARNDYRVDRRLRAVLAEALETDARIDSWGPCADILDLPVLGQRIYLIRNDEAGTINLAVYPADTLAQAREFYRRQAAVQAVRELIDEPDWSVGQNFHWGHFQAGYAWTNGPIAPASYLDIWVEEIDDAGVVPREEWPEYLDWLEAKEIALTSDRDEFDRTFTDSQRMTATPRPGIEVARSWAIADAENLDDSIRLIPQVKEAFARLMTALSG